MNFKLITLSAAASAVLTAATPMVPASMSTDNGGTKSAIDAYSDGGGVVIINQAGDTKFDNSAMNGLVFKYGETAKSSNTTLKNQVSVLSADTTAAEKAISVKFDLAKVVINPPVNGTSCDDGNPQTVTDVWSNGLCGGNNIENQLCNDGDIQTINDKYHNSICAGTNVEGVVCNDDNIQTITDIYHNGVCAGTNVEGQTCNDNNALTFADKYTDGICAGVTNGTTCNDGNALTFADKYTTGVCAGVANGVACNDSNAQTINDVYTSGVCAGTNVEGQACNDNIAHTYADKYTNGVCAGTSSNSCNQIKQLVPGSTDGVYTIDLDGAGASVPFNAYCDMTTDGGGWTLVAWNKGVSYSVPSTFFVGSTNPANISNKSATNAASSINVEAFSMTVNTSNAMLKSAAYSASPIIDRNIGQWTYNTTKCSGTLNHTSRTAGCAGQNANDNWDGADRFNIAIGQNGIVPGWLNSGQELCYSGAGWCNFEFYLK